MGAVNAGQLRERVTLLSAGAPVSDGRGGWLDGPESSAVLWARVRPLRSTEKLALGQVLNADVYEITIRQTAGISAKQRLHWNGRSLNVQAVTADEHREYYLLTCVHGGALTGTTLPPPAPAPATAQRFAPQFPLQFA